MKHLVHLSLLLAVLAVGCQTNKPAVPPIQVKQDTIESAFFRIRNGEGKLSGYFLDSVIIRSDSTYHKEGDAFVQNIGYWGRVPMDTAKDSKGRFIHGAFLPIPSKIYYIINTIPHSDIKK